MEERKQEELIKKSEKLKEYLRSLKSVAIAFSGGVDSTYLMKVAHDELGDNAIAITAKFSSFPEREMEESIRFCKKEGIRHEVVSLDQLEIPGFKENPKDRCYLCKKQLFTKMKQKTEELGVCCLAEGSNMDDLLDYRPGMRAIVELHIKSPLRKVQLTKQEIRDLSKMLNLSTWEKPSLACLSTRLPYGELITKEKLSMIEKGENLLCDLGFHQMRVRVHGNLARIEILPEEFSKMMDGEVRKTVIEKFKSYGFTYVSLDLLGYRSGSMNINI